MIQTADKSTDKIQFFYFFHKVIIINVTPNNDIARITDILQKHKKVGSSKVKS